MSFCIARPINGITINPQEYVLDDNNEVMKFDTEASANEYLKGHGYTDEQIECMLIKPL